MYFLELKCQKGPFLSKVLYVQYVIGPLLETLARTFGLYKNLKLCLISVIFANSTYVHLPSYHRTVYLA